jgi:hypothetical protein
MADNHSEIRRWSRSDWLFVAGLVVLALAVRLAAGPRTIDDAYITFRYARNLARGLGFAYNPGHPVLGTTTPLYTGLMSSAYLLGFPELPSVAWLLNALVDAVTVGLLYWFGKRVSDSRIVAAGAGLAWALSPMSVTFAIGGMETSVVILFLVGSFSAYVAGRSSLGAGLMAFAVLTRPDALIAAGLLFADMALRPLLSREGGSFADRLRRLPWTEGAIFCAILLPWILFASMNFGSPLPQSVQAKVRAYNRPELATLIRMIQHLATPFFEHEIFGRFWPAVGFPLYLFLYLIGGLRMVRGASRTWSLALYPLVYVAVFSAANAPVFRWYLAPPLPAYFLGILLGLHAILAGLASRLDRQRLGDWALALVVVILLAFSLNDYVVHPDHGPDRPSPEMAWVKLELYYQQAAGLLEPHLQPGEVIAVGDIGAIGWFTDAPLLDTVGLVSPEVVPYYPLDPSQMVIVYAISAEMIRDFQPDYLVTLEIYVRESVLRDPWFHESYTLIEEIDTSMYESHGMLIFKRRW